MTVITPSQRQLIFTTSFSERFQVSQPSYDVRRVAKRFLQGRITFQDFVALLLPLACVGGMITLLVGGTSSVVLSYRINRTSTAIEQQQRVGEALQVSQAEFLSPEALRAYAGMVQLSNPAHTHYMSQTADVLAAQETLVPLP